MATVRNFDVICHVTQTGILLLQKLFLNTIYIKFYLTITSNVFTVARNNIKCYTCEIKYGHLRTSETRCPINYSYGFNCCTENVSLTHHPDDGDSTDLTSETLVNLYQSTRRYNPEDSHYLKPKIRFVGLEICAKKTWLSEFYQNCLFYESVLR
jgi:hypothetical protein